MGFEREIIGERLRESRAARRARGLRSSGRVPFSYQANPATRQLEVDLDEAEVVREFFRRAAAGENAETISRWATEQGITTKANRKREGARWSGRTILQLIRSPLYFGKVLSGPAFVDEGLAIAAWEASPDAVPDSRAGVRCSRSGRTRTCCDTCSCAASAAAR